MTDRKPDMAGLFRQLGLPDDEAAIAGFIREHQLPAEIAVAHAPYWRDWQRLFLMDAICSEGDWAGIVDDLSEALHAEVISKRQLAARGAGGEA